MCRSSWCLACGGGRAAVSLKFVYGFTEAVLSRPSWSLFLFSAGCCQYFRRALSTSSLWCVCSVSNVVVGIVPPMLPLAFQALLSYVLGGGSWRGLCWLFLSEKITFFRWIIRQLHHILVLCVLFDHGSVMLYCLQVYGARSVSTHCDSHISVFLHLCPTVWRLQSPLFGQLGVVGGYAVGLERFSMVCVPNPPSTAFVCLSRADCKVWGDHRKLATPETIRKVSASEAMKRTSLIYSHRRRLKKATNFQEY